MDRGDIWFVNLESSVSHEQKGFRLVLIVSPAAFNKLTNAPVVLPITTVGSYARRRGFAVSLQKAGTRTTGIIRCDQPRAIDIVARNGRYVESVPRFIVDDVLARLATIFE